MRDRSWWYSKASALAPAFPSAPLGGLVALLAVATHETMAGDAWPGSRNWGATTRGLLSNAEHAQLTAAGVAPVLTPPAARLASEAAATEVLGVRDDREIHVDSRPARSGSMTGAPRMGFHRAADERALALPMSAQIVYFTWFAKFASDVEGAAYFATFFRTGPERDAIAAGDSDALARAMFWAHYYTGFSTDAEADIAAYAGALRPLVAEAHAALVGWTPGAVAEVEPAQGWTWPEVQRALNDAGAAPQLVVDGIVGPRTRGALGAFQRRLGLPVTSCADEATVQALRPGANA